MTDRPSAADDRVTVGVVGAGVMGRGIAQLFAAQGHRVMLHDVAEGAAPAGMAAIGALLEKLERRGKLAAGEAAAALQRITAADGLEALAPCGLVIEAVVEDLGIKRSLFADLAAVLGPQAILATNTSSLSVTAIARDLDRPERLAGLHFFNPAPLMRVVEVVRAARTDAAVIDRLVAVVAGLGHRPVIAADTPGFIVNHAGRALTTEGVRLLADGVADAATIDRIVTDTLGLRMGPFAFIDLVGLDVFQAVTRRMAEAYWGEPRFQAHPLIEQRVEAGLLGRKTGQGFYAYVDGKPVLPAEPAPPAASVRPVWISRRGDPSAAAWLADRLAAAAVPVDAGPRPRGDSLCLVLPVGDDATTALLAEHLPADRTVAVDPLGCGTGRLTLMTQPGLSADAQEAAVATLARLGLPVSAITDTPGGVAQRVAAMIVATAAHMAQQRIATPADIDTAVMLGLGHPKGPFALGDAIGPARVVRVLDRLFAATGDPRYRPVPWITRRASLGLSLSVLTGARS